MLRVEAMGECLSVAPSPLIRSDLWNSEKQLRRSEFPSLGRILADQIGGVSVEESERLTAESYRTRLY